MATYTTGDSDNATGGREHRYHYPAADCERRTEATCGSLDTDPNQGESKVVPESLLNTENGPARGTLGGKSYPDDKWRDGF